MTKVWTQKPLWSRYLVRKIRRQDTIYLWNGCRDSNSVVTTAEAILKPKFYFFVFPLFATKSNWESYQLSPSIAKSLAHSLSTHLSQIWRLKSVPKIRRKVHEIDCLKCKIKVFFSLNSWWDLWEQWEEYENLHCFSIFKALYELKLYSALYDIIKCIDRSLIYH